MTPDDPGDPRWLAEARYRAIVEDQPDLVCRFLADGTLTFANDAYCRFFGLRRAEVLGQRYQPVVHPDDLADVQSKVASISQANPVVFIENRVFRGDGAVRWTEWTNRALFDDSGRLVEYQSAGRDVTERKRAQEDTAHLAAIVTSADLAIYSTTLDGILTSWNRAAERMFGYSAAEVIGRHVGMLLPADSEADSLDIPSRVSRGETIEHVETEKATKSGRRVPVSLNVSPIVDTAGRVIGISRIARDMSERRRVERELQERDARFRLMADHAPVLIWIADTANRGIYFNQPWLDFTGLPLEAQLGDGWLSLIHPDDQAAAGAYCQQHFEGRLPFTMEFRLRHHSGHYRWVQDSGRPLFLSDGTFNGYIGSCTDIEERKTAADRIRNILEGISDAFSAVDEEWRFTYVNDRYVQMTGKTRDELLGRVCWDVFSGSRQIDLFEAAHRVVRDREPARLEDYYAPLDLWCEVRLYPAADGLISFVTDISERKRLEKAQQAAVLRETEARAAAEEASRLKDEFLAIVSHELRTPLNAVLGWAHMLRAGSLDPESIPRALDTIERNARVQAQLVEDLLDVSRIVTGTLALRVEPVDVIAAVHSAADAIRPAADRKGIELAFDLSGPLLIAGDGRRLQQVIWNLLTNAIKFTPSGGRITVSVAHAGDEVVLAVRDTGIGIHPDALPIIFDRFRQGDSRTTRAHGGLGLGLCIVQHIVTAHGGSVDAESAGPGTGATFRITLPVRPAPIAASTPRPATAPPDLSGCRILVVDDDLDALELARAVLEQCGALVTTATSVADGVRAGAAADPELLIGDIGMPGRDGYELIRLIRSMDRFRRIPALALTAYASAQNRDEALHAGYDEHLGKPLDPDVLCEVVSSLRRRRMESA